MRMQLSMQICDMKITCNEYGMSQSADHTTNE